MKKIKLTVIILNYNTKELLKDCLESVNNFKNEISLQVIVSDNNSSDGSYEMIRKYFPWVRVMKGPNSGYSKGNNRAKKKVEGEYVLFLNPDTIIHKDVFRKSVEYMEKHEDIGVLTCKLMLPDGRLDKDSRRRFPTPKLAFNKLFLGRTKDYYYENFPDNQTHEVEAVQGAFLLTKKKILDRVGWFDENYLFDGEDLDLCYQIKKIGYKIIYFPEVYILHYKGVTKGKVEKWKHKTTKTNRLKFRLAGVNSMERFFKKNLWNDYPLLFSYFVLFGIKFYKIVRYIKVTLFSSY